MWRCFWEFCSTIGQNYTYLGCPKLGTSCIKALFSKLSDVRNIAIQQAQGRTFQWLLVARRPRDLNVRKCQHCRYGDTGCWLTLRMVSSPKTQFPGFCHFPVPLGPDKMVVQSSDLARSQVPQLLLIWIIFNSNNNGVSRGFKRIQLGFWSVLNIDSSW